MSFAARTSAGAVEPARATAVHCIGSIRAPAPTVPYFINCLRVRSDIGSPNALAALPAVRRTPIRLIPAVAGADGFGGTGTMTRRFRG
ncbi:hypothetical protein GCM10023074_71810 [Microbispora amethystogenes]